MAQMLASRTINPSSNKPIWYFLFFWTLLNVVQAYTLELHGDEAYYWVYSKFLDWGYFDHPPMVAVFILLGDSLMHNELGLRLLTVITNSASIYIIWLILKKYGADARWFILVTASLFIVHMYGFTTTPDVPLLFFAVLFYYSYQQYIDQDSWKLAVILGIIAACLLYSKYHAVLLMGFTILSNPKLLRRKTFYAIVVIGAALYIPHILWQVNHHFPSIQYHLYDRSMDPYRFEFTYTYPLGQLLMAGPLIGWFLFYSVFRVKINDVFIRGLVFNCIGTFLFFFLTTFKGVVEIHWTLIAYVPLILLVMIGFGQRGTPAPWVFKLSVVNIALIVFLRLALVFHLPFVMQNGHLESYFGFRDWAKDINKRIGDAYLMIPDGFQDPSKYNYYTNSIRAMAYDSRYYHKTQYDIWPVEDSLQNKKVFFLSREKGNMPGLPIDSMTESYHRKWYFTWINNTRTYQKVDITYRAGKMHTMPGEKVVFVLDIYNPYPYDIKFSNPDSLHRVNLRACFFHEGDIISEEKAGDDFNLISLKPDGHVLYNFSFKAPLKKGKYDLLFSIQTTPFIGSKNSRMLSFVVD